GVDGRVDLLGAHGFAIAELQVLGDVDLDDLVGVARRRRHRGQMLEATGGGADLLTQFPPSGLSRVFSLHIQFSGRDLVDHPAQRHPMLADEPDAIAIDRQDGDSARMADDVANHLLAGIRTEDHLLQPQERRLPQHPRRRNGETRVGHGVSICSATWVSSLPVACRRSRPAPIRPVNNGWGSSGRLRSSGWAWVATKNGWSISSMNSTR